VNKNVISCLFCLPVKTLKSDWFLSDKSAFQIWRGLIIWLLICLWPIHAHAAEKRRVADDTFFTLENGTNLRILGGKTISHMLVRIRGQGNDFGEAQRKRYCKLKHAEKIQWALNDLETGEFISRSANADELYFGASVAKLYVAAALLNKQNGHFDRNQLTLMVKMIVVSSNSAWKELQRQAGDDGTDDSGRAAVDAFVQSMGYTNTKGFQGWWNKEDGTRIHGNELSSVELAKFVHDTYHRRYKGAEVLWEIMQATVTGRQRINKYAPQNVFVGGKTGTYDGPNASPATVKLKSIRARNHVVNLKIDDKSYGLAILSNTGSGEDVAILGGGLMREYLGVEPNVTCQ
jgi:hypothetical protein